MADQIVNVNCGFFDAINHDRVYKADDMNRPYRRVISNGVFATPQGTASTDLQVLSAGDGMKITVNAGQGLFGDKWFENPATITFTVPNNTNIVPRRDSVIVQVDTTQSGRAGNIVYRTGTPNSNPVPPDIGTVTGVIEYRVANIYVAASATNINNDAIVDLRGSSECPWVTSLIQQVDTSTLWTQWQAAYQNYYDKMTAEFEQYETEREEEWDAFFDKITTDLSVEMNLVTLTSSYVSTSSVTTIPINIPSYKPEADILQVYINGLMAFEGTNYTVSSDGTSITLTKAISSGQTVTFYVWKSVVPTETQTYQSIVQELNDKISTIIADSGWINFYLESGATAYDSTTTPAVRCVGDRVYLRGAFKGVTSLGSTICTLPVAYRPKMNHVFTTAAISGTTVQETVTMQVLTTGQIKLMASSGSLSSSAMIPMNTNFVLD